MKYCSICFSWYFGDIKRAEAVKLLMTRGTPTGTFLVRESKSSQGNFALSLRDEDSVVHFKIRKRDSISYYMGPGDSFSSLYELVQHYLRDARFTINIPYPKHKKLTNDIVQNVWEIPRKSLRITGKLNEGRFSEVWAGVWNNTTKVAVKVFKPGPSDARFLEEERIMQNLRHKRLVQVNFIASVFPYDPSITL